MGVSGTASANTSSPMDGRGPLQALLDRDGFDDVAQLGDEEALGGGAGGFGELGKEALWIVERLLQLVDAVHLCVVTIKSRTVRAERAAGLLFGER